MRRYAFMLVFLCSCAGLRSFVTEHQPEIEAAKVAAENAAAPAGAANPVAGAVLGAVALGLGALVKFGGKKPTETV